MLTIANTVPFKYGAQKQVLKSAKYKIIMAWHLLKEEKKQYDVEKDEFGLSNHFFQSRLPVKTKVLH